MRFKGLDLNLLVALDRLLTERNVSRAAERLHLSQSAASGALARLRDYFGDDLLIQAGRGMALTPRGEALALSVRKALMQIDADIIQPPDLDISTARREIKVITSDYVYTAFLAEAIRRMQADAPGIGFRFLLPNSTPTERLARGEADFVAMPERFLAPEHPSRHLFSDGHSALVSMANHLVGDTLDLETFMALHHVTVQLPDGPPNYEAAIADIWGNRRRLDVVVSNFTSVPFQLAGTDRVAIVYSRLARIFCATMPLRSFPAPVDLPALRIGLQWHALGDSDKLLAFVRDRLLALAEAQPHAI